MKTWQRCAIGLGAMVLFLGLTWALATQFPVAASSGYADFPLPWIWGSLASYPLLVR